MGRTCDTEAEMLCVSPYVIPPPSTHTHTLTLTHTHLPTSCPCGSAGITLSCYKTLSLGALLP